MPGHCGQSQKLRQESPPRRASITSAETLPGAVMLIVFALSRGRENAGTDYGGRGRPGEGDGGALRQIGAEVVFCGVDEAALASLQCHFPTVVTTWAEVEAFFDIATEHWCGAPDVVCANAGTAGPSGAIDGHTEHHRRMNLKPRRSLLVQRGRAADGDGGSQTNSGRHW